MLSENNRPIEIVLADTVLILVLVEHALGVPMLLCLPEFDEVLILVLVEHALGGSSQAALWIYLWRS